MQTSEGFCTKPSQRRGHKHDENVDQSNITSWNPEDKSICTVNTGQDTGYAENSMPDGTGDITTEAYETLHQYYT